MNYHFDLFGHAAFFLVAMSLMVKDIFWLRIISITASLSSIVYNYFVPSVPLWLVINWNVLFIVINLIRIFVLAHEKMSVKFSDEEYELYETQFRTFSPVEFMKILRSATWQQAKAGEVLAEEGKKLAYLMLIYHGSADVNIKENLVTTIKDGDFVGEMTFDSDSPATASVVTNEDTKLLVWNKKTLKDMLTRNPSIHFSMQSALSSNLVNKLKRTDDVLA